jgi:hypothetical protein
MRLDTGLPLLLSFHHVFLSFVHFDLGNLSEAKVHAEQAQKFGEVKGPLIVWLVFTLYYATLIVGVSSGGTIPQDFMMTLVLSLLFNMMSGGVLLVFLIVFSRSKL